MSKKMTKEQLLKAIGRLEKNPNDRVGILAEVGITAAGAVGAGAAAALFGATTAAIPIITVLTGATIPVAAPLALVAGAAVAGAAAMYGVVKLVKDGGIHEGKQKQLLDEYKERLKEIEIKERSSKLDENDKTKFHLFLREPLQHDLISPDDAYQLMQAVENGHLSLSEAYKLVGQLFSNDQTPKAENAVIQCPNCSQKLRVPNNLGELNLTCPKCKYSWSWIPK
ncbi:MAG TPA: hypothetical protein V6C78_34675 [Crinalium sp.]|jgi:hypothetical protein